MLHTTLRSITAHKARLAMTALAIVLGVALMSGTLVLTDTVGKTFDDLVSDIYADTDGVVRSTETIEGFFGEDVRSPLAEDVLAEVEAVPEVAEAEGFVQFIATIIGPDGEVVGSGGGGPPSFGMSWGEIDDLNPWVFAEGGPPTSDDEAVIDAGSASSADIAVGDTITVESAVAPRELTVSGIVRFGSVDSPGGANMVAVPLPVAQEMSGQVGLFNEIGVVAIDGVSQPELADALNAALPDQVEAITGEAKTEEDQQAFADALGFFNTFLLIFALVALFVGSFIISNTFSIIVAQRGKELALLRAIGASRRQVLGSVMGEALLVGLVASGVGAALGIVVASVLRAMLAGFGIDIPATGTVIEPASMAIALTTGLTITVLAALLPSWRASKVPPIAALRDTATDVSATSIGRIIAGILVLLAGVASLVAGLTGASGNAGASIGVGAAVVFLGVAVLGPVIARPAAKIIGWPMEAFGGVTGRLARENAARSPKRTASSAAALMIGVGLVGFITIFAASATASIDKIIDDSVTGDVVVAGEGFGTGFSPELTAEVAEVDGVELVGPIRIVLGEVDGSGTMLTGVDVSIMSDLADPEVVEGDVTALGADGIAISSQVADQDDLALGDTVVVRTETGEHELTVGSIYDNRALTGDYVVDLSAMEVLATAQRDIQTFVSFADGTDPATVVADIERVAEPYASVEVQDLTEYKASQSEPIDQMLNLIYAMLGLAVIIALIGIANTLALSIHERTRELGLLRAVGMKRDQLAGTVVQESVIIALLGAFLGLIVGLFFGWALVQALANEGIEVFAVPIGFLVLVMLIAALAGVLAAVFPAHRASKLDILDSIAAE